MKPRHSTLNGWSAESGRRCFRTAMRGVAERMEESTVVRRRETDDLAVVGDRVRLVRLVGGEGADVEGAPVARAGRGPANQRAQQAHAVEPLVRKGDAMPAVPPPAS